MPTVVVLHAWSVCSFIQHWLDLTDGIEYEHGPDPYTDPYEEAPGLVDEGIEIPQGYYISHLGT